MKFKIKGTITKGNYHGKWVRARKNIEECYKLDYLNDGEYQLYNTNNIASGTVSHSRLDKNCTLDGPWEIFDEKPED